jgi:hypothetical protein
MKKLLLIATFVVLYAAAYGQRGVGIGVNPPTEKLHVVGNFRLQGAFMPNNLPGTAGQVLQSNGANNPPSWIDMPQGGGGGYRPFGKVNFVPRFIVNDSTLGIRSTRAGIGSIQDDSVQVLIRRGLLGLPYSDLNYFTIIEAANSGLNTVNNQRIALHVRSQDSTGIDAEVFSTETDAPAVLGVINSRVIGSSAVVGVTANQATGLVASGVSGSALNNSDFFPIDVWEGFSRGRGSSSGVNGFGGFNGTTSATGHGVYGTSFSSTGFTAGVYGETLPFAIRTGGGQLPLTAGVMGYGYLSAPTGSNSTGVLGLVDSYTESGGNMGGGGYGVYGITTGGAGTGVRALAMRVGQNTNLPNAGANYGVFAAAASTEDRSAGVYASIFRNGTQFAPDNTGSPTSGACYAVFGESYMNSDSSAGGKFVSRAANAGIGAYGVSHTNIGVVGLHAKETGTDPGVCGWTKSTEAGSSGVMGVVGDGDAYGVFGITKSSVGQSSGVYGFANPDLGTGTVHGVTGVTNSESDDASGVTGVAAASVGRRTIGVYGETNSTGDGIGVYGYSAATTGEGVGVLGVSNSNGANAAGVIGRISSADATAAGVFGEDNVPGAGASTSWAGWFNGNVNITGQVNAPTANAGIKSFLIDHPLDPENKTLRHFCAESNEALNVYSGNIVTDANGTATVRLPDYFQALNTDFRYQLTTIGQFANAIVSKKIEGNVFEIKTDKPNVEVSWQITGKRNDPFVKAINLPVEEAKSPENRGKYLYPFAYKLPESRGIHVINVDPKPTAVPVSTPKALPKFNFKNEPPRPKTEAELMREKLDKEAYEELIKKYREPQTKTDKPAQEILKDRVKALKYTQK